ncbi:hypothetical protein [Streptomyces sp. NPDC054946]
MIAPASAGPASHQYQRFAAYLAGALQRVQISTSATFASVSPVNEPGTAYWRAGGLQEGSHWAPGAYRPNTGRNQSWSFRADPAGG